MAKIDFVVAHPRSGKEVFERAARREIALYYNPYLNGEEGLTEAQFAERARYFVPPMEAMRLYRLLSSSCRPILAVSDREIRLLYNRTRQTGVSDVFLFKVQPTDLKAEDLDIWTVNGYSDYSLTNPAEEGRIILFFNPNQKQHGKKGYHNGFWIPPQKVTWYKGFYHSGCVHDIDGSFIQEEIPDFLRLQKIPPAKAIRLTERFVQDREELKKKYREELFCGEDTLLVRAPELVKKVIRNPSSPAEERELKRQRSLLRIKKMVEKGIWEHRKLRRAMRPDFNSIIWKGIERERDRVYDLERDHCYSRPKFDMTYVHGGILGERRKDE